MNIVIRTTQVKIMVQNTHQHPPRHGDSMPETIDMSGIITAEMQHEIDAVETERKMRACFKKWREEGRIK
jgi:hypothetical protein